MVVEVKNSGAPSIAERWKLLVTIDGKEYEPMGQEIPQPLKLKTITGQTITYSREDALYDKSVRNPIPRGGQITGVLQYLVDIDKETAQRSGLKLKLTFVDIVGKSYTAVNLADSKIGPTRYPGLTY